MGECVTQTWHYWLVASLVFATAGIVFIATVTYWQDKYHDLLRQQAAERSANQAALQDVRIREQVYGSTHLGLLVKDDSDD